MNGIPHSAAGSVPTATFLDYLNEDINRPDLYEEQSFIVKDIHGPSSTDNQVKNKNIHYHYHQWNPMKGKNITAILYTVGIIILSAAIFITLVSWADVLRSWFDSHYINSLIEEQLRSRIYFAITVTIISIITIFILFWLWWIGIMRP